MLLSNLLPGIRNVRAPLTAGYLWLVALWVLFSARIEPQGDAPTIVAGFENLHLADNPIWVAAGVTAVAYIVGVITTEVMVGSVRAVRGWQRRRRTPGSVIITPGERRADVIVQPPRQVDTYPLSSRGRRVIEDSVQRELKDLVNASKEREPELEEVFRGRDKVAVVAEQLGEVASRLRAAENPLFDEVDRLRAEAEFRYAVSVPISVLCFLGLLWWRPEGAEFLGLLPLAAIPAGFLIWLAFRSQQRSNDVMADALLAGVVRAPCFELLQARVKSPKKSE